ncbi:hypothetical protein [Rhodopirellula islandica]|nr:hypothetical protein [Rhodopirellula islandica]
MRASRKLQRRLAVGTSLVLMSPYAPPGRWMPGSRLSDDGIHSNARGSMAIAKQVANAIRQMYGDSIFQPGYQ